MGLGEEKKGVDVTHGWYACVCVHFFRLEFTEHWLCEAFGVLFKTLRG